MASTKKSSKATKKAGAPGAGKPSAKKARATKEAARDTGGAGKASAKKAGPPVVPPTDSVGITTVGVAGTILTWEDDPKSEPERQPIQLPAPTLPTGTLGITITGAAPPAQIHPIGTSRFRYWTAAAALTRGMEFWGRFLPAGTRWATPTGTLQVHLDLGTDLNAYYRRGASQLEFYHSTIGGKTVYSGESPNIVCHELGHAVLDAIRPQLFHAASIEAAAFHESFGDISAILSALQLESVRQAVLTETGGRLYRSTHLSRMAEELGWAIRQLNSQAVDPDCLRNAVNSFFYRDPSTLPPSAPASALSSAPHSFSRVFTAAFYDALAGMVITDSQSPTIQSLHKVSRDAGRLIIDGIRNAPVVPNYFSQVAAQIIAVDQARFNRKYRGVLKGAFVRHGILSLEAATSIVGPPAPVPAMAGVAGMTGVATADSVGSTSGGMQDLLPVQIPAAAYGLNANTILCASPGETGGYLSAAASALDIGSITPPRDTDAARSFVEDLFRLGRIDIGALGDPDAQIAQPTVRKTHALRGGAAGPMLVRETFDCGFD